MGSTASKVDTHTWQSAKWARIRAWLSAWEIYPLLAIAAFLRLYQINTTEFDDDQAVIFRMAHDALVHGLLPATSNIASIRILNPPAVIYFLMLPAAFSADPLWGAVLVGLFNTVAVLLTYFFVRRYYGRLAATVAALLYATAVKVLEYSRFMWQQNMMAPLVLLFLFALYWGVVERRKGWLFPALFLLGVLYQLHETTTLLIAPLLVALVLAPGTVRWRDLAFGLISLLVIFSTYLLWEFSNKFGDVFTVLKVAKLPSHIDNNVILFYWFFLNPYGLNPFEKQPTDPHLLVYSLVPILFWVRQILLALVIAGFMMAIWGVVHKATAKVLSLQPNHPRSYSEDLAFNKGRAPARDAITFQMSTESDPAIAQPKQNWWTNLRKSPDRCGLLVLLFWQIVPLLVLSRHSVALFPYYLLMLMPGPFILIGLFLAKVIEGLSRRGKPWRFLSYGAYVLAGFLIILQLVGSTAAIIDDSSGNTHHGVTYNVLQSLQDAVNESDQLAQQRHLNRVYIATDEITVSAFNYLAEQMHTPATLFDASRCLVLPNPADGPAVLLVGPGDTLTIALLHQFDTATLVNQPARLGGTPFQLYIVKPLAVPGQVISHDAFAQHLQPLDGKVHYLNLDNRTWTVSDWNLLRSASPGLDIMYSYILTAFLNNTGSGQSRESFLNFSSLRAGDQLLVAFDLPSAAPSQRGIRSARVLIMAKSFIIQPYAIGLGPLHFETFAKRRTPEILLRTEQGKENIILQ